MRVADGRARVRCSGDATRRSMPRGYVSPNAVDNATRVAASTTRCLEARRARRNRRRLGLPAWPIDQVAREGRADDRPVRAAGGHRHRDRDRARRRGDPVLGRIAIEVGEAARSRCPWCPSCRRTPAEHQLVRRRDVEGACRHSIGRERLTTACARRVEAARRDAAEVQNWICMDVSASCRSPR